MGLSAVVITYNEEANIERCLRSLSFADEIVVLDSFSTDRTVDIARLFTDKVGTRKFDGFSYQKTAAVEMATQEWVLVIDADEVVTPDLAKEIQKAVDSGDHDAYRMPRLSYFLGRPMRHCGWYPDYQLRLARKSKAYFPPRFVHETMEVKGSIGTLKHDLLHYTYPTAEDCIRKTVFYARASARQRFEEGRRFRFVDMVFHPMLSFLRVYVWKQGFRDGLHGFMLSLITACSSVLRHMVLWEMTVHGGLYESKNSEADED